MKARRSQARRDDGARCAFTAAALLIACLSCGASGNGPQRGPGRDWDAERSRMVEEQLKRRDIHDARVLDAILKVPRHLFVPEPYRAYAYSDAPLPIGHDQTI